ncbi:MAG: glycosyltransferase family 4 protein [Gammaproteobacteria bacterium]|nr:glycosyltransferase family 4 protein [Gammaproteobacteria bacterium]
MPEKIAIILKGYPRLSETFIAQEIRALELRGIKVLLFSLRHPTDPATHPIHAEIKAPVVYLPEYVKDDIPRVFRGWWRVRKCPGYKKAWRRFIKDLKRDFTANRMRRFAQALVLANEVPESVRLYYAHFMHTPASVTYYASMINEVPWSISAHAKDIWTIGDWEKREKLDSCEWLVTCTAANVEHLRALARDANKVSLLYHGLDFKRFNANTSPENARDGGSATDPVQLISVGRAVDKKGFDVLLDALAALPAQLNWTFSHIGGGELMPKLQQQARELGLESRINWLGALPQTDVLALYRQADLFVLPSRISNDGDRDGLPNVLMEAQSQRLACLSTNISGIPELIIHEHTGWLVPQQDSPSLCDAIQKLIGDPQLRNSLAQAGFERVHEKFSLDAGIDQLVEKLRRS